MRVLDCPHCHRRVGVLGDGLCPQCRRNVDDRSGLDASLEGLVIHASARLPNLCSGCGVPSTRRKRLIATRAEREVVEKQPYGCFLEALGIAGLIAKVFIKSGGVVRHGHQTLTIDLPRCDLCAGNAFQIVSTMLDSGAVKIVVHRQFKTEYQSLNGGP